MNTGLWFASGTASQAPPHALTPPTVEQIRNVQTNFCNLRFQVQTGFDVWLSMTDAGRQDALAAQRAAGSTHITSPLKYAYHGMIEPKDWLNDPRGFVRRLFEAIAGKLIPEVTLTQGDGSWDDPNAETRQFANPSAPTYGPRIMDALRQAAVQEGLPDPTPFCLWRYGWEPDPRSVETCIPVLRQAVGSTGQVALHLQAGYGNPTGDGRSFWTGPVGQMIDVFLYQGMPEGLGGVEGWPEFDEFGQPAWEENAIEIMDRMWPTGYALPGIAGHQYRDAHDGNRIKTHPGQALGPDWFGGIPFADRPPVVLFEKCAYCYIRRAHEGPQWDQWVQDIAHRARQMGFTAFGNGVPR